MIRPTLLQIRLQPSKRHFLSALNIVVTVSLLGSLAVHAFLVTPPAQRLSTTCSSCSTTMLQAMHFRDADLAEQLVGGIRYSMIPLPVDMRCTTLFVGNLEEFVQDDDLSRIFNGNPACVVRKPDMTSLQYGFVAFRTSEEAKAALIRTCGLEWRGKRLEVQEIRREPVVRVPEKLVAYVKGVKAVDRILKDEQQTQQQPNKPKRQPNQKSKPKKDASSSILSRLKRNLKQEELAELDRALGKGFLVLSSQRQSRLVDVHRLCCDARGIPQVMVIKGKGGNLVLDRVLVDLSPLRLQGIFDDPERFLVKWKADILAAAASAGVHLLQDYDEDVCEADVGENDDWTCAYTVTIDDRRVSAWATQPITKLPPVSLGIFAGERPHAKAMAKELSELWDLADPNIKELRAVEQGNKKGKAPRRNRGGGNHQAYW